MAKDQSRLSRSSSFAGPVEEAMSEGRYEAAVEDDKKKKKREDEFKEASSSVPEREWKTPANAYVDSRPAPPRRPTETDFREAAKRASPDTVWGGSGLSTPSTDMKALPEKDTKYDDDGSDFGAAIQGPQQPNQNGPVQGPEQEPQQQNGPVQGPEQPPALPPQRQQQQQPAPQPMQRSRASEPTIWGKPVPEQHMRTDAQDPHSMPDDGINSGHDPFRAIGDSIMRILMGDASRNAIGQSQGATGAPRPPTRRG